MQASQRSPGGKKSHRVNVLYKMDSLVKPEEKVMLFCDWLSSASCTCCSYECTDTVKPWLKYVPQRG